MDRKRTQPAVRRYRRLIVVASIALVATASLVAILTFDFSTHRVSQDRVAIDVVKRGTLQVRVAGAGVLLPREVEEVVAQSAGRVTKVHAKAGDVVRAGQLLLELSSPDALAAAETARSALEGAQAELRASQALAQSELLKQETAVLQAQFDVRRAQVQLDADANLVALKLVSETSFINYRRSKLDVEQLTKKHSIEQQRLQTLQRNLDDQLAVSRARVGQMARAYEQARNQVANLRVHAGIDGTLQLLQAEVGQQLAAGHPLGRVARDDRLYAQLRVAARDATDLRPGLRAIVDTRRGTVEGTVSRIDPGVVEGTVRVDIDLAGAPPPGSRPHMAIDGTIVVDQLTDTLYVARPAFVQQDADIAVYRLDESGKYAVRATVKAGKLSVSHMQVRAGLQEGDRIITSSTEAWQDRDRVLID